MMKTPPLCIFGIYLLLTSQTIYSLVLLSANIDDVRQLAKQFVSAPLADKIANFLAKATVIKTVDISEENYRNNQGDKLSDSEWNRASKRQSALRNDEVNKEADDRYRVSGKRGRIVLGMNREDGMQRDLTLDRPSLVKTKKNFVYDYALRQGSAKEPNFEWKKAANFDFLATSNQRNVYDTSNIYAYVPNLARTPNLVKSTKDDVLYENKKPAKEETLNAFKEIEKPAKEKTYLNIIKENNKLAKIEAYSDEFKKTLKPVKVDTYLEIIKESPKPIEFEKDLDAPKIVHKSTTTTTISKPIKNQSNTKSDVERNKNNIETDDESWETDRVSHSKSKTHGFTRFADYYETTETTQDVVNKHISEGSIYTKESVLATSGPVELLKASVKLVYSSDENSLNDDNRNYFKEYDSDSASRVDFRRHLEPKSLKSKVTTPVYLEDANEVDSVNEDNVAVTEENPHRTTDPEERPRTDFRYGGARVYNNVEHEQAAEDFARSE